MNAKALGRTLTIDEVIQNIILRETSLMNYCSEVLSDVGPDAEPVIRSLRDTHRDHIVVLEALGEEIRSLRELSIAMAD